MNSCTQELIEEAKNNIRVSIERYLSINCHRIVSMTKLAGQRSVRMEFYGFFKHYVSSENFPRFVDAYSYLIECHVYEIGLSQAKIELKKQYLEIHIEDLEKLCLEILRSESPKAYNNALIL